MKKGTRKIKLDKEQVRKLAQYGCTNVDISDLFGVGHSTLDRNYRDELQEGRAQMRSNLRKRQIELAMEGNCNMLIWLGKCILGQSEFREDEVSKIKEILIRIDPARLKNKSEDECQQNQ